MRPLPCCLAWALSSLAVAQSTPPPAHVVSTAPSLIAFTNATLHVDARTVLNNATLVVKDGEVMAAGNDAVIPAGAVVRDMKGLHIWPALIDPYSDLGLPTSTAEERKAENRAARHWNDALRADAHAHELFKNDPERASKLREQGFGAVITHRMDGIARGTSAVVLLNDEDPVKSIARADVASHFSFRKGSSTDGYPSSLAGAIALVRQAFLDARWYSQLRAPQETDAVLHALGCQLDGRVVCEANDRNDVLRWAGVLNEFQLPGIIKGSGDEYARLNEIKATGLPLIIPFALPEAYDVEDPFDAQEVSFARLKHWAYAPFNAAMLDSAAIPFALTAHGHTELGSIWAELRKLVACGLDSSRAIEALTSDPARLFGLDDRLGTLRKGMIANFLITSHHLLHEKNILHETWVQGHRFMLSDPEAPKLQGTYELNMVDAIWTMEITGEREKQEVTVKRPNESDSSKVKVRFERQGSLVSLAFAPREAPAELLRLTGTIHADGGLWDGQGQRPGGAWFVWSAIRRADKRDARTSKADTSKVKPPPAHGDLVFPLVGYGWRQAPAQESVVLRNATVWTNTSKGILRNTDVLMHRGKIIAVGEKLDVPSFFPGKHKPTVLELDAAGKHLTCGIIDEHSHIALSRGVNEGSHAITSEVRMGDVVNPDDVNIYRDLAGGVTTAQLLHGSANPIGGQSALIKLLWGHAGDSLLIRDAPKRIKFALGENVKQSNWSNPSPRFPQSRMGVEQLFYDAFHRARSYAQEWSRWAVLKPKDREGHDAPRRDLRLEALAEILRGERDISCHSYVQSEIAMLMHVADSMGFTVNTFTHILEGYKVAARMREHGASASTFSDWWAYKFEVYDAIPYNAALLQMNGVNTGINSDDAEMSRRLNQEAAKAVKYGGVSAEEAWKMVTLNPARMLKLDHRIGTVETGKDADLVLWSADPLSIEARAIKTYVDGACYYDEAMDRERRAWVAAERDRIVRAMLQAKGDGAPTKKARRDQPRLWECDDIGDEEEQKHDR
ncbi:MAG: amidohydrolase family protein [Flavobacteriales bacterium]|nr:amidohydrolase family protein [Flavobacteriales bacterium]